MKFDINKNLFHKILPTLLYLNACIILVPDRFKGIPVILLLLSVFFLLPKNKIKSFPIKKFLVLSTTFFLLLISILYTQNLEYGLKRVETQLAFIAYPLIFSLLVVGKFNLDEKILNKIKLYFIYSVLFFCIASFGYYFYITHYGFMDIIKHYSFMNFNDHGYAMSIYYRIHPIYLSLNIGLALLMVTQLFLRKNNKPIYNWLYFAIIIFTFFLIILLKRTPILSLLFCLCILFISNKMTKYKKRISIILCTFFISVFIFFIFYSKDQFYNPNSPVGIRINLFECAGDIAFKSPIIGYGVGDVQDLLFDCIGAKNTTIKKSYNSHNQFLSYLLSVGIVGLVLILLSYAIIIQESFKKQNYMLIILVIYFFINMITENILEREDGLLPFVFFLNLLFFSKNLKTNE